MLDALRTNTLASPQVGGASSVALGTSSFLVLAADASLASERVLTAGDGLAGVDSGVGAAYTLSVDSTVVRTTRTLTAGAGMTGGGDLSANRTFNVIAGDGITVNANDVALTVPGTLTVATANAAAGSHTHAITSSSNPGAAASLLASSAAGYIQLVRVGVGIAPLYPVHVSAATQQLRLEYNSSNYVGFTVASDGSLTIDPTGTGANLTLGPAGDVIFNPVGNDILPLVNYDLNIGAINKKYLTLHAAELWVETLVAQETIATIGGRILVGPTTTLSRDMDTTQTSMNTKHNQIRPGDRVYLEAEGKVEFIAVTAGPTGSSPDYGYTVTRNLDGTGGNLWYAGDAVFNTGTTGNGFMDLYSMWGINARQLDFIHNYNQTGSVYSANYYDSSNFSIFASADGANTEVNDMAYFGRVDAAANWTLLTFQITTAAVYTATIVWEFWNGAAWTSFTPTITLDGASTGTALFKAVGQWDIAFGTLTGWAQTTAGGIGPALWVRLRITAFTSFATPPVQSGRSVRANRPQFGPTIVGNVRNSGTFNDWSEHWAIGNLNGLYGYGADIYGVALGKYSTTTSYLTADATNGIRMMRGSTSLAQWAIGGDIVIGEVANSNARTWITAGAFYTIARTSGGVDEYKFIVQADGDVFIGRQANAAASTAMVIFNNAQTYNTEAGFAAGDILIGDNSASKSNMFWDASTGRLNFRGGQTTQLYIETDGSLTAGAGAVTLDANGISLDEGATTINAVKWYDASTLVAHIYGLQSGITNKLALDAYAPSGVGNYSTIEQSAVTGEASRLALALVKAEHGSEPNTNFQVLVHSPTTTAIMKLTSLALALTVASSTFSGTGDFGTAGTSDSVILRANGVEGSISLRSDDASNLMQLSVRPNASRGGYISFTEDAVADRWNIGIKASDAALYFRSGAVGSATDRADLDASGNLNVTGSYEVDGTKVVGNRDTGWGAFTGTTNKATVYATGTVTLVQLAERVAAIQAALTTHGLLGA